MVATETEECRAEREQLVVRAEPGTRSGRAGLARDSVERFRGGRPDGDA